MSAPSKRETIAIVRVKMEDRLIDNLPARDNRTDD